MKTVTMTTIQWHGNIVEQKVYVLPDGSWFPVLGEPLSYNIDVDLTVGGYI